MLQGEQEAVITKTTRIEMGLMLGIISIALSIGGAVVTLKNLSEDVSQLNKSIQKVFTIETDVSRVAERAARNTARIETAGFLRKEDQIIFCLKLATLNEGFKCP